MAGCSPSTARNAIEHGADTHQHQFDHLPGSANPSRKFSDIDAAADFVERIVQDDQFAAVDVQCKGSFRPHLNLHVFPAIAVLPQS
jgi:hypothetical protein